MRKVVINLSSRSGHETGQQLTYFGRIGQSGQGGTTAWVRREYKRCGFDSPK